MNCLFTAADVVVACRPRRIHRAGLAVVLLLALPALGQQDQEGQPAPETTPQGAPPSNAPPPPPANPPAPPAEAQSQAEPPAPQTETGQWMYTSQYGWVWVPYGDEYVYTPEDESGEPYLYLYYPARGWRWVAAPWVWGLGPLPYFGPAGAWRFHWYRGPAYHARVPGRPLFRGGYVGPRGGARGGRHR